MRIFLIATLLISFFFACNNKPRGKVERKGEPTIYGVEGDDVEMNQAIHKATQSLPSFDSALKSGNPAYESFALKARFDTEDGAEHIWVSDISLKGGKYLGIVDNLPNSTKEVRVGDTIEVAKSRISDWMFIENGFLHGGYTIRVLRSRMSETERKAFETENGIIIKD
jgi:uncharacterized protein YegJ (DUF2314 family)